MTKESDDLVDSEQNGLTEDNQISGMPFGGTLQSIFLLATIAAGIYFLYYSITNTYEPTWKVIYWTSTTLLLVVSVGLFMAICNRYGLGASQIIAGLFLSTLAVVSAIALLWTTKGLTNQLDNGTVLLAVLAVGFSAWALVLNMVKSNLVFGILLTAIELTLSLALLVIVLYFWSQAQGNKRRISRT